MLGKINKKDPSDYLFRAEVSDTRLDKPLRRAFRPRKFETDSIFIYLLGSLTGYYDGETLKPCSISDLSDLCQKLPESDFVRSFEGLYLFYLYDKKQQRHMIVNNRYQLTKLYYAEDDSSFYFSSTLKPLLQYLPERRPEFRAVFNFLMNGFNVSDQTQIEGVRKLLPCHWVTIDRDGVRQGHHWNEQFSFERKPFNDLNEHLDRYEDTYRGGLRAYLDTRKPAELATLLSGGHDTSFVMIQSSKVFEKPVHAFTTVFPTWHFSEEGHARNICEKFGGRFHPVPFGADQLDDITDLINATEEPVLGSSLPLHVLAKQASQVTDTMLGGDGGDTLWGEYYPVGEYHRWVKYCSHHQRKLLHWLTRQLRKSTDWERFWELEHVAELFTHRNMYQNFMQRLCTYRHFSPSYLDSLLNKDLFDGQPAPSSLEIEFNRDNFDDALIEGKLFNAFFTYQSFAQTRSMNAQGMEFFLPTVNRNLMQFVTSLPKDWVNGGTSLHRLSNNKKINRRFHKQALRRYLRPDEIYNRSFDIPWFHVFSDRPHLLEVLKRRLVKRGWFNAPALDSLFDQFRGQSRKDHEILELKCHGYRIMALLALEVWAMQYLDLTPSAHEGRLEEYLAQ